MDSSKKTTVKLSRKIDLRGSQGRIFLKINTTFNTYVILAVFFRVYSRRISNALNLSYSCGDGLIQIRLN